MRLTKSGFLILGLALALTSCATSKVARIETEEVIDLSGRWNDTDSRLVAEEMIKDVLNRVWLEDFKTKKSKVPTVIVGTVANKSHEHINVQTFIKDLEKELINSGRVKFVASREEREEVREERKDQQYGLTESSTTKQFGKEIGADYMLKGSINTIVDEIQGERVTFYQVDLELIDIETNSKSWIGQKKIKKLIKRSSIGL